jgi:hypothetical protein
VALSVAPKRKLYEQDAHVNLLTEDTFPTKRTDQVHVVHFFSAAEGDDAAAAKAVSGLAANIAGSHEAYDVQTTPSIQVPLRAQCMTCMHVAPCTGLLHGKRCPATTMLLCNLHTPGRRSADDA